MKLFLKKKLWIKLIKLVLKKKEKKRKVNYKIYH